MAEFDYAAPAELYSGGPARSRRAPVGYRRFPDAAQAIRFAVETLAPMALQGACIEIDEIRYTGAEIERLYKSEDYPLERGERTGVDVKRTESRRR